MFKKCLIGLPLILVCSVAMASNNGWYMGGSVGYPVLLGDQNKDVSFGGSSLGLEGGYNFMLSRTALLGLELNYEYLGQIEADNQGADVNGISVNVTGHILSGSWDYFGKFGFMRQSVNLKTDNQDDLGNNNAPSLTAGAGYSFTPHWDGEVAYQHIFGDRYTGGKADKAASMDIVSIGGVYTF